MLCKKKIAQIAGVVKNESFGGSGFWGVAHKRSASAVSYWVARAEERSCLLLCSSISWRSTRTGSLSKMNALEKLSLVTLRTSFGMCMYVCPLNVCVVLCKTSNHALCLTKLMYCKHSQWRVPRTAIVNLVLVSGTCHSAWAAQLSSSLFNYLGIPEVNRLPRWSRVRNFPHSIWPRVVPTRGCWAPICIQK